MLARATTTASRYPRDVAIHDVFAAHARRAPEAIAVVGERETLSYDALNRRANQLARRLTRLRLEPEARIGVMIERSEALIVAQLAILKAGYAYVPLDPTLPHARAASLVGMLAALGEFRSRTFLHFLGLEAFPRCREGGRLVKYRGKPPLSDRAFTILQAVAVRAAEHLEELNATRLLVPHVTPIDKARAIVALMRLLAIQMWQTARAPDWDPMDQAGASETSARARQKGPPHPPYAIASACRG